MSRSIVRALIGCVCAGTAAAAYMLFEAQWLRAHETKVDIPGLPDALEDLSILHLSDVHTGRNHLNMWTLEKAVRWALRRSPDLVVLTGDVLGSHAPANVQTLRLLSRLRPRLGIYAVTGNHEYGISKNPLSRVHDTSDLWQMAGITLLRDRCVTIEAAPGARILLCGADYLTGGVDLERRETHRPGVSVLAVHRPPVPGDVAATGFDLVLAGHTHGGQLRAPTVSGLHPLHAPGGPYLGGLYREGPTIKVVSRGVGTTFVPFRLLSRPEVCLLRLSTDPRGPAGRAREEASEIH